MSEGKAEPLHYAHWRIDGVKGESCELLPAEQLAAWAGGRWPEGCELLKAEPRREARRLEFRGRPLLAKRFAARAWLADRARRVHYNSLLLQGLGIRVPMSLGYARGGRWSLQVAEWLADAVPLLSLAGSEQLAERVAPAVADLLAQLARLHRNGLVHGDLKWGNLLLRGDECWLVDLDSLARARPGKGGARDLARFTVDCEEAGAGVEFVRWVQQRYAAERGWTRERVESWMAADYSKISERHRRRYGAGHRL